MYRAGRFRRRQAGRRTRRTILAPLPRLALPTAEQTERGLVRQTTLHRLLPRRFVTPAQCRVIAQFVRFGIVGAVGFLVDTATVYAVRHELGLYGAGVAGYVTAATANWVFNRLWTFRGQGSGPAHRQWAMFMVTNLGGFVLNRGTYALLVTFVAVAARQPVIAIAAGAIAGLAVNFTLSRRLVFR
jgi:putative flippase GtrA